MSERFVREKMLIGEEGLRKLQSSHVAVFGVGGVGGHLIEALCRAGIGELTIIDGDTVARSNINRQIIALESTIGEKKAEVMMSRISDINPEAKVHAISEFFTRESDMDFSRFDYIADAIDSVSSKLEIIKRAKQANKKVVCAMGAGNKLDATGFIVSDIAETREDPLARVMRQELRKLGITGVKVVYSEEKANRIETFDENRFSGRPAPGSISYVPPVMGMIMAGEIIKDLLGG